MAFCMSGKPSEEVKRSLGIDKDIRDDRRKLKQDIQILLLGAGESGKSTIFKQLKILQDNGSWTEQELLDYRNTIYVNITSQMHVLVLAAEKLGFGVAPENIEKAEKIKNRVHGSDPFNKETGDDVIALWGDQAIKSAFSKRDKEFQLNDSSEYFLNNLPRINQENYIPVPNDALRTRIMTKGIIEANLLFDDIQMKIIDVGGQRSQRRKWIHCFDGVSAVIFVAALSEYDQYLREDSTVNRMDESLNLFKEIVNSKWFSNTSMILFLNKKDIFTDKLQTTPFITYDPKYKGANTFEETSAHIKSKFLGVREKNNQVYTHFTIAIDTQNINFVFKAVKEIVLREIIQTI